MGTSTGEVPSPESFPGTLRDGHVTQLAARRHFLIDCREELPSYLLEVWLLARDAALGITSEYRVAV